MPILAANRDHLARPLRCSRTTPVLNDPLVGRQVFSAANWWNLDITAAPVMRDPRR